MRNRSGEKIKLSGIDELLGVVNEESAMEIDIASIHPFAGHPFKVIDDDKMQDLVESVRENGVITPVLIRPAMENQYEMISGHRRMHTAKLAGLSNIPAIVREMTDDEAVIAMVDANIQREELLPSEKAFAYKMKLSAMKRQAGRPGKNNSSQNGTNLRSDQVLAEEVGISRNQIQRYIRLTELIPELLNLVDDKKLQFTVAVEISYIDKEIQKWIYEYIRDNGFIKPIQITALHDDGHASAHRHKGVAGASALYERGDTKRTGVPREKDFVDPPPSLLSGEPEGVFQQQSGVSDHSQ